MIVGSMHSAGETWLEMKEIVGNESNDQILTRKVLIWIFECIY